MSKGSGTPYAWETVSNPPEPVVLDLSSCCQPVRPIGSAIDGFYSTTSQTLTLGTPDLLRENVTLGRLLVLGLVTGVENYFRTVLLGVTSICPLSRDAISDQMIALGAVDYYGAEQAALGLFEGISFASEAEIKKRTKQILGLTFSDTDSLGVALSNYERICHMRHASVHSQGVLNRGNARALGIPRRDVPLHLVIDLAHLHLAAKACVSAVRAYNDFAYKGILQRWITHKILVGAWDIDKKYFGPLYELFYSAIDNPCPKNVYHAYRPFQANVLKRLSMSAES